MTANISDETRVTGTIACSGSSTENLITNAILRTALGITTQNHRCEIGSANGYYTQFAFRVTAGGGRTWDFAADFIGDGTYSTLGTGLATNTAVLIGHNGGSLPDGTGIGSCRPFSFKITMSAANASDVIAFEASAVRPTETSRVINDLSTLNLVYTRIGTGTAPGTVCQSLDQLTETQVPAVAADAAALVAGCLIATGTLDGAFTHTTTVVQCSTLSGSVDYYGTGCRLVLANSSDSSRKAVRTISSYSTANKRITVSAAFPWTPINGDTFAVIPA